jgi:two-component system, NtrC family, response regulator AtoC
MDEPIRILIIDDEWLVRWALATSLTPYGCVVVGREDASSGTRALTESSDAFDVILLDCKLPDSQGLNLLATLKRLAPTSRVMMMSAHMSRDEVDEALRLGASAFVPKPFDLDAVRELILNARSR